MLVFLGIGGFVLALTLLRLTGVTAKPLDLALYIFSVSLLPLICALVALRSSGVFSVAPGPMVSSERGSFFFLLAVLLALPLLFFDFSLAVEPLHYLTVMAPAVQLLNGGTLLVDTFSHYGPGVVMATFSGFVLGPLSFGTANIVVQSGNLIYYAPFSSFCIVRVITATGLPPEKWSSLK